MMSTFIFHVFVGWSPRIVIKTSWTRTPECWMCFCSVINTVLFRRKFGERKNWSTKKTLVSDITFIAYLLPTCHFLSLFCPISPPLASDVPFECSRNPILIGLFGHLILIGGYYPPIKNGQCLSNKCAYDMIWYGLIILAYYSIWILLRRCYHLIIR